MFTNNQYEDLTPDEADFILDIYRVIRKMVLNDYPVTLVRLGYELGVSPRELSDYLPIIISVLNKVETEYEIR
jgi:hypothetical protein